MGQHGLVEPDSPKLNWVEGLPRGESMKSQLARLVDERGDDDAEREYYETAADPLAARSEREQRRYRGAFMRRVRRLAGKQRHT